MKVENTCCCHAYSDCEYSECKAQEFRKIFAGEFVYPANNQ